uniref:C2 domain-containing protein n=1 Tax=Xiphophorus maculatus TaxID=8083 RepID=M4AYQ4_XIPMA
LVSTLLLRLVSMSVPAVLFPAVLVSTIFVLAVFGLVLVVRALKTQKVSGHKPDGYVKVYYGSRIMGQTSLVKSNRNPSWSQRFNYYSAMVGGSLTVRVYDKDVVFDDFLGSCTTKIERGTYSARCNLSKGGTLYFTYTTVSKQP